MLKKTIKVEEVVELLNDMYKLDPEAAHSFITQRVHCNKELADHPTIQVNNYTEPGKHMVGLLGFLNGLFGTNDNGYGCICAIYDNSNTLKEFRYCPTLGGNKEA